MFKWSQMSAEEHLRSTKRVQPATPKFLESIPWILLAIAVLLQVQAGLAMLPGDLLSADPPAHFTTGVMLHDYLLGGHVLQPLPFAECFYVHFPKVAFGHWPPVFYIVEALWFFFFGTKIVAARWLCACIAGGCAAALYRRCCRDWGKWQALATASLFLALPAIRHEAWRVMSDLLVCGLAFLAMCSLADYLSTGKPRHAVWLAIWASLAILTKGSGWLLLAPIVAGPLLTGRSRLYATWHYWTALGAICIVSAPFYLWVATLHLGYPVGLGNQIHRFSAIIASSSIGTRVAAGSVLLIVGVALVRYLPRKPLGPRENMIAILMVWGVTVVTFINLLPLTPELARYYLVLVLPAAYLLSGAMAVLERRPYGKIFAALVCGAALLAFTPIRFAASTTSFSQAIGAIPISHGDQVILIESDSSGEGALIASRLETDHDRSVYMLRGTKFLSVSTWSGYEYSPKYDTPAALHAALESVDPDYVILDGSAQPTPDSRQLETELQAADGRWKTVTRVPVALASRRGELVVYRSAIQRRPGAVPDSVQLGPERGSQAVTCRVR
jgi:hypothetical protein